MNLKLDRGIYSHLLVIMNCLIGILIFFASVEIIDSIIRYLILMVSIALVVIYLINTNLYVISSKIYGLTLGLTYGFYIIVVSSFIFTLDSLVTLIFFYVLVILIVASCIFTIVKWRVVNITLELILIFELYNWMMRLFDSVTTRGILLVTFICILLVVNMYLIIFFGNKKKNKIKST